MPLFISGTPTPTGASFPSGPVSGDRFYRTDRGLEYFYDGTRWLTTAIFSIAFTYSGQTVTNTGAALNPNPGYGAQGIYVEDVVFYYSVSGTGNWDIYLAKRDSTGAQTALKTVAGITAAAQTANLQAVDAVISATDIALTLGVVENSGTATFLNAAVANYRFIG